MLVLERQLDDRIVMELPDGGRIIVAISKLADSRVKVAINAPDEVRIICEELQWRTREGG